MMNGAASESHKPVTCLDFGGFSCKFGIMDSWFPRRFFMAILALLIALGLGLPAVQASAMPEHMAIMQGMSDSKKTCPDCDKMNKQTGLQASCTVACVVPALSALPPTDGLKLFQSQAKFPLERTLLLHGMISPPEPYPPRFIRLV